MGLARLAVIGGTYVASSMVYDFISHETEQKITSTSGKVAAWVAGTAVPAMATIGIMHQASRLTGNPIFRAPGAFGKGVAAVALLLCSARNPFLLEIKWRKEIKYGLNNEMTENFNLDIEFVRKDRRN